MMLESTPGLLGRPRKPHGRRALARVLRESGVLRTEHAVDIVLDVCDALVAAHENGIVHGQIAPHTVQVAFSFETGPKDVQIFALTPEGDSGPAPAITPLIAPEQRDRERKIDTRVDIWALGALLLTMVTGKPPAAGTVTVPEGAIPRSLAIVIESCLALDPDRRPQTVTALAEAIASFASSPPDRFEALAERRAVAERTRIQRERLERRGLSDMPSVLDKLDDLALRRARGTETATIASLSGVLDKKTNEKDLERLMKVVRSNTEDARLENAARLPSLIDVEEDEDEMNVPTTMLDEGYVPPEPVMSPLTSVPVRLPDPPAVVPPLPIEALEPSVVQPMPVAMQQPPTPPASMSPSMPAAHEVPIAERSGAPSRGVSTFLVAAIMVCLGTTVIGFFAARAASSSAAPPTPQGVLVAPPPAADLPKPATSAAPSSTVQTFSPSSLPDAVLTTTPDALPSAKKKR